MLWVYRHKRIESYIGFEHVFVSWPVWNACSIQAALWGLVRFSDAPNAGTLS